MTTNDRTREAADRSALRRLADALGWEQVPELSEAEQRETDLELAAANARARRIYQLDTADFERGWDAALDLVCELVHDARDACEARERIRGLAAEVVLAGGTTATYQPGERVALVHTDDPFTGLRPGAQGTVVRHDTSRGILHIRWDSGSSLRLWLGAGDRVRRLRRTP